MAQNGCPRGLQQDAATVKVDRWVLLLLSQELSFQLASVPHPNRPASSDIPEAEVDFDILHLSDKDSSTKPELQQV